MHDIALHLHKAEERGEDLPILAITLGNDPMPITLDGRNVSEIRSVRRETQARCVKAPHPIATAPLTGFDVPWGSQKSF